MGINGERLKEYILQKRYIHPIWQSYWEYHDLHI